MIWSESLCYHSWHGGETEHFHPDTSTVLQSYGLCLVSIFMSMSMSVSCLCQCLPVFISVSMYMYIYMFMYNHTILHIHVYYNILFMFMLCFVRSAWAWKQTWTWIWTWKRTWTWTWAWKRAVCCAPSMLPPQGCIYSSFCYEVVLWLHNFAVVVMNPLYTLPLTSPHNNKDVRVHKGATHMA